MASTMGEDAVKICVVNEVFCASHPVEMVAKRTAGWFSKTDFQVVDSKDKALIFHVEVDRLVLHQKRIMFDAAGSPILTIKAKAFSMHERWKIYRGDSTEKKNLLFHLKASKLFQLSANLDVFLLSNTSEKCDFHVTTKHSKKWCTIYKGDSIVAEVSDESTSIWGKEVMVIRVYPHVDHAFITALFLILYEIKLAQKTAAASGGASARHHRAAASAGASAGAVA